MLPRHGAVVLAGPTRDPVEPPWEPVVQTVRQRFGLEWRANSESYQQSGRHHQDVLAGSPFRELSAATFRRRAHRDAEGIIGLQLSLSFSTPARLGPRLHDFVEAVAHALAEARPTGGWPEEITTEIVIARRP
jgi:hypothetical protein